MTIPAIADRAVPVNANTNASSLILEVRDLSVLLFTEKTTVRAVCRSSYSLKAGETIAIVGESGSGKTVMNLAPLGLLPAGVSLSVTGSVTVAGEELVGAGPPALMSILGRKIGVIFQDPLSALNPNRRIESQITEILALRLGLSTSAAESRAAELLQLVGIPDPKERLRLFPHEMSGGMRQRVMIAIALAGEPELLIADEPTTALDVTIQAQILELLRELQKRLGMALVLITHDIGVVANVADQVAVMYAGTIVEMGSVFEVLKQPRHPYTRALLASVPSPDAAVGSYFTGLPGSPPDLSRPVVGCSFAPRCGLAMEICRTRTPTLVPASPQGTQTAACWVTTPPDAMI